MGYDITTRKINDVEYLNEFNQFFALEMDEEYNAAPEMEMDDNLEEIPVEHSKQQLSDTYINFLPKNTSGYTLKGNVIDVQIPRTEHVISLAKAFIYLDLNMSFRCPTTFAAPSGNRIFVGMLNSATIFDQVRINNNGKTILSDTFVQVNSRIWQMTKPGHYLKQQYASFLNIDDITNNEGFIAHEITGSFTAGTTIAKVFKIKIPLPCLFNCFDNANNFSTSNLTDDITLTMQLSSPERYMCLITTNSDGKVLNIQPFDNDLQAVYKQSTRNTTTGDITNSTVEIVERSGSTDLYYIGNDLKITCPAHYPTETESQALLGLVENQGVDYPFITCDIQEQKTDFGLAENQLKNGTSQSLNYNPNGVLNYNTHTNNIFAVLLLASHYHSYVAFDKPLIDKIECNLSELIKLANGKVHSSSSYSTNENTYKDVVASSTYTRDNDMYKDLINALGTDGFRNLDRFDDAMKHDYMVHNDMEENMLASYMQFYAVSCGQMLGVSSDYFAHQINFKYESKFKQSKVDDKYYAINHGKHNWSNSSVFCCELTFKRLLFVNGGLDIECPMSENYDIRRNIRGEATGNAHGLSKLFEPITNLLKSAGSTIKNEIHRVKRNKNTTYAYSHLGKDGYEKHKDIIEQNGTMGVRKFKKFIDNLVESEKQLTPSHGLGDPNALGGTASTTIGPGNQQTETEKGVDLSLLNLNVYHKQSRNADFADRIGWKHQLILDYKYHANIEKLRLNSWGTETAIIGVNNAHGLGRWLKKKWNQGKTWVKEKVVPFFKKAGKQILKNAKSIAMDYARQVLSGQIKLSQVPDKFKERVRDAIQNGDLMKNVDPLVQQAIDTIRDIKDGKKTWQDVPSDVYNYIKSHNIEGSSNGNGLIVRHGFYSRIAGKPSLAPSVMKRRIQMLLEKNPIELKDKELRKIYTYKRLHEHPIVDSHGTLAVALKKLYGEPLYKRILVAENHHGASLIGMPNPMYKKKNPLKGELISKYFGGNKKEYKKWKYSRTLAPHEDAPIVNSPFQIKVDATHGLSDAEKEAWKKHKAALMTKFIEKMKKKGKL